MTSASTSTDQRLDPHPIPFNIPDDRPSEIWLYDSGNPGNGADPNSIEFATTDSICHSGGDIHRERDRRCPSALRPDDAVANMRVSEQVFAAADGTGA